MYFVYILRCRDERLYTGITTDVRRRFGEHSGGVKGAKFTRSHPPREIAALWSCPDRSTASKLEYALKQLKRSDKLRLIDGDAELTELIKSVDCTIYNRETPPEPAKS